MGKLNYENNSIGVNKTVTIWDCVTIAHCRDIAIFRTNWTELFEHFFTLPEESKSSGGKTAKTEWIVKLASIANNNSANYSVSEEEYLFLKKLYDWLLI
ncbi:hypothetical protein D3C75_993640 [compost metagenome]